SYRRVYRLLPVRFLCHIKFDESCLSSSRSNVGRKLLAELNQNIAEHHLGSFAHKESPFGFSLSAGSPRDQRYFASKSSSHALSPLLCLCRLRQFQQQVRQLPRHCHHRIVTSRQFTVAPAFSCPRSFRKCLEETHRRVVAVNVGAW